MEKVSLSTCHLTLRECEATEENGGGEPENNTKKNCWKLEKTMDPEPPSFGDSISCRPLRIVAWYQMGITLMGHGYQRIHTKATPKQQPMTP